MSHQIARRWFNVDEYYRMAQTGILSEDDRVELIEGEIIQMSPIGSRHAACVGRLTDLLAEVRDKAIVWVQNPIRIDSYSEPEPDVALLRKRADFYSSSLPTPVDVLLVIEVADTSVEYDRDTKIPLYAGAGIAEALLVNLPGDVIEYYSEPVGGRYQAVRIIQRGESFTSQVVTAVTLSVEQILGERGS